MTRGKRSKLENADPGAEIRVMIVDDHEIVRQGLAALIGGVPDMCVCAEAADPPEALAVLEKARPDVLVLDITLGEASGLDLLRDLRIRRPNLPVLVLSMHDESVYAERCLRAGAQGYIMKREGAQKLAEGIRTVSRGGLFVGERVADRLLRKSLHKGADSVESPLARLTDREMQIFKFIGLGYGTKQIADTLCLSVKTIETHREHIKAKLELDDARELLRHAVAWARSDPSW